MNQVHFIDIGLEKLSKKTSKANHVDPAKMFPSLNRTAYPVKSKPIPYDITTVNFLQHGKQYAR